MLSPYPDDQDLWQLAVDHGLEPCPVIFDQVPAAVLYEHAAYLIPGRMAHWSFGKQYQMLKMRHDYGVGKLYEMVVNTNPAYAFLLDSNSSLENTLIRCHVMGHVDFFQTNQAFSESPDNMIDVAGHHADRIRQYEFQFGKNVVEDLLDRVMAIEEHADWSHPFRQPENRQVPERRLGLRDSGGDYEDLSPSPADRPRRHLTKPRTYPTFDLLEFLMNESEHLEDWQRDVIGMVREEMRYFWPQIRTKIMNEGWATYWHLRLMHELELDDRDFVDFARLHASVVAPNGWQINPYGLGSSVFQSIHQKGGDRELFLVREIEEDTSFLRNHLTTDLVQELNLFIFGPDQRDLVIKSQDAKAVRDQLVRELTHGGIPVISVVDGDFHNRGELYLRHHHDGLDLDIRYAEETLRHLYCLWGRPVHIQTVANERPIVLSCDAKEVTKSTL